MAMAVLCVVATAISGIRLVHARPLALYCCRKAAISNNEGVSMFRVRPGGIPCRQSRLDPSMSVHPLQPVGVGDAPESLRGIGEDLKQPHENPGYSVHVPSHFDFPGVPDLVIVYLRHPGSSRKPSELFHVHKEVLNQPHENASYPPVSIIHNHPAGCMSHFDGAKRGVVGACVRAFGGGLCDAVPQKSIAHLKKLDISMVTEYFPKVLVYEM
ncbi:hypothetical protein F5141DRAFT_1066445 [Pisolithus sp. B1]|nr:hypothetical protein F5141DRAFT_1066445 [Pisolithus sp. B1]